jgi:Txe/YoeB family toxin of toxin-antitoxin system
MVFAPLRLTLAYKVIFSRQALKDLHKLKQAKLGRQAKEITDILMENPYQAPPRFERLSGDLRGYFSRRINIQHRYIYQVMPNDDGLCNENGVMYAGIVHVLRMWTHYE